MGKRRAYAIWCCIPLLLATACTRPPASVPLNAYIDSLHREFRKTEPLYRLTGAHIAREDPDGLTLLRTEQDAQCSNDPILLFSSPGELTLKLSTTFRQEAGTGPISIEVIKPAISISDSTVHELDYRILPIAMSMLPDVLFKRDVESVHALLRPSEQASATESAKVTSAILQDYLTEKWATREALKTVVSRLIEQWKRPPHCQR